MKTLDPNVFIEEQREGYVRYQSVDGKRWEVHGVCDGRAYCMVGAVVDGVEIKTLEQAKALSKPVLDSPVGLGFRNCCPLKIVEL